MTMTVSGQLAHRRREDALAAKGRRFALWLIAIAASGMAGEYLGTHQTKPYDYGRCDLIVHDTGQVISSFDWKEMTKTPEGAWCIVKR